MGGKRTFALQPFQVQEDRGYALTAPATAMRSALCFQPGTIGDQAERFLSETSDAADPKRLLVSDCEHAAFHDPEPPSVWRGLFVCSPLSQSRTLKRATRKRAAQTVHGQHLERFVG
jgi:hypothetical protein